MRVLGIDPAPSKGSTVFDGNEFWLSGEGRNSYIGPTELIERLGKELEGECPILVCWDAPLSDERYCKGAYRDNPRLWERPVERFLRSHLFPTSNDVQHEGISIRPFGGCPHWTISQYVFGLPRFHKSSQAPLNRIQLVASDSEKREANLIAEVHPALALWMWFKDSPTEVESWKYKRSAKICTEFHVILQQQVTKLSDDDEWNSALRVEADNDDQLDAKIAWMLGWLWANKNDDVRLLGNGESGAMLLPFIDRELWSAFTKFKDTR